ncbi:MAG TPA: alpha/beta hydrolase [Steroidobacteraceae bacterium]|nr:alpha/beta hydrolase [Steroidobacteraceae bacterium]
MNEFIEIRGARLRVRTAGAGPAVLLVHGWALDLDMWTPQFAALAGRYRLIAFDRRGFGLSSGTPGIEEDLSDIHELLATLAVEHVAIVGMSQGARVALRWAIESPATTTSLVLDGPPRDLLATGRQQGEITLATYRELVRNAGIDAFRKEWLEHPLMHLHTHDTRTRTLVREMVERYPGHDLLASDAPRVARVGDLDRLEVPILIVNGEYDSDTRIGAGAELARALPQARLAVIPGAGHLSNLDNPHAYNKVLGEFLAGHARAAASSEYVSCRAE